MAFSGVPKREKEEQRKQRGTTRGGAPIGVAGLPTRETFWERRGTGA